MLLSGEAHEMTVQMQDVLDGYTQFHDFDLRELQLIEALLTLRMLHHAAWLARRWQDPAFPIAFPWFGEPRYWEDLILGLREQLGRIHAVGACRQFNARPELTIESFGRDAIETLDVGQWVPAHLETAFFSLARDLMISVEASFERAGEVSRIRLHGDCHPGNILWRDGPFFVDLDDCRSGPAVQDLWMLLSGEAHEMAVQMQDVLDGYTQFHDFNLRELQLIEALRTLRMLHHAAWLARRWQDPAFPIAFPWFGEPRYWEDLVLGLREQLGRMQEPAITCSLSGS